MEPKFASNTPGRAGIRRRLVACLLVTRPLDRSRRARGFPLEHQRLGRRLRVAEQPSATLPGGQTYRVPISVPLGGHRCVMPDLFVGKVRDTAQHQKLPPPKTGGLTKSANCCPRCLPRSIFLRSSPQRKPDNLLILFGSPGRIRTSDQPVNSRLLYR